MERLTVFRVERESHDFYPPLHPILEERIAAYLKEAFGALRRLSLAVGDAGEVRGTVSLGSASIAFSCDGGGCVGVITGVPGGYPPSRVLEASEAV